MCLSEAYLDSSILNEINLQVLGYSLYRENLLLNTKQGGVCVYYKILFFHQNLKILVTSSNTLILKKT